MRVIMRTAAVVGILALASSAGAQTDPNVGTWKLNLAKSKYNGASAPKSATVVVESAGNGVKMTATSVRADGSTRTIAFTANYDGKDAAVTGTPDYNSVSMTRNGNTVKGVRRRGGKRAQTFTTVVSADGKSRTTTAAGTDALGKKINTVQVYDRQ
ncbi:MAG TPA: hypothetical protein VGY57_12195 [Vicinamibacterales bacterium]|nr:hypothetical protein [Vicinamibacterales bacterium]